MRNSGRTIIIVYLKQAAKRYGLYFIAKEGIPVEIPYPNSTIFYVTNLRDPVSILLSD